MDAFAELNLPRQPWLETETVKERFIHLSRSRHPDHAPELSSAPGAPAQSGDDFARLNEASRILSDPRQCLRHFLEIEAGSPLPKVDQVPGGLVEDFLRLGPLFRKLDAFLAQTVEEGSPMLKAAWVAQAMDWSEQVQGELENLQIRQVDLCRRIREETPNRPALEAIYHELSYLGKWISELQSRQGHLADW